MDVPSRETNTGKRQIRGLELLYCQPKRPVNTILTCMISNLNPLRSLIRTMDKPNSNPAQRPSAPTIVHRNGDLVSIDIEVGSKRDMPQNSVNGVTSGISRRIPCLSAQDSAATVLFLLLAAMYLFWFATRPRSSCAHTGLMWCTLRALALSLTFSTSLIAMDILYDAVDALIPRNEREVDGHVDPETPNRHDRRSQRVKRRKVACVWVAGLKMAVGSMYLIGPDRFFTSCC